MRWVVCSEVWFQESCLGLGVIYLFIILINDTFFLLDLLGTEWPGSETDLILPLNSYWCLFWFAFYLHKWETERDRYSLTESQGIPWGRLMDVADTHLPRYQTSNNFCPHTPTAPSQWPLAPCSAKAELTGQQCLLSHRFDTLTPEVCGQEQVERTLNYNFCN